MYPHQRYIYVNIYYLTLMKYSLSDSNLAAIGIQCASATCTSSFLKDYILAKNTGTCIDKSASFEESFYQTILLQRQCKVEVKLDFNISDNRYSVLTCLIFTKMQEECIATEIQIAQILLAISDGELVLQGIFICTELYSFIALLIKLKTIFLVFSVKLALHNATGLKISLGSLYPMQMQFLPF